MGIELRKKRDVGGGCIADVRDELEKQKEIWRRNAGSVLCFDASIGGFGELEAFRFDMYYSAV